MTTDMSGRIKENAKFLINFNIWIKLDWNFLVFKENIEL